VQHVKPTQISRQVNRARRSLGAPTIRLLRLSARPARPMFGYADHPQPIPTCGRRMRAAGIDRQPDRLPAGSGARAHGRARVRSARALTIRSCFGSARGSAAAPATPLTSRPYDTAMHHTLTHRHGRHSHSHVHSGRHRHLWHPAAAVPAHDPNLNHDHSHGLIDDSIKRSRDGVRAVSLAVLGLTSVDWRSPPSSCGSRRSRGAPCVAAGAATSGGARRTAAWAEHPAAGLATVCTSHRQSKVGDRWSSTP
jgi:hypothetical protein